MSRAKKCATPPSLFAHTPLVSLAACRVIPARGMTRPARIDLRRLGRSA